MACNRSSGEANGGPDGPEPASAGALAVGAAGLAGEPSAPERCGPLELMRMRKADGRALLIYRRAPEPPA